LFLCTKKSSEVQACNVNDILIVFNHWLTNNCFLYQLENATAKKSVFGFFNEIAKCIFSTSSNLSKLYLNLDSRGKTMTVVCMRCTANVGRQKLSSACAGEVRCLRTLPGKQPDLRHNVCIGTRFLRRRQRCTHEVHARNCPHEGHRQPELILRDLSSHDRERTQHANRH